MRAPLLDPLQLLALLWPDGARARGVPVPVGPKAWEELDRMAGQHRLRPLLHHRAGLGGALTQAPEALRQTWALAHHRSGLASLRQRAVLQNVTQLLAAEGIHSTVLKGGAFVWSGWFDPALRPMRDLDLLIAPELATKAYCVLRDHGFHGPVLEPGAVEDHAGKHLPGLTAPDSGLLVELHVRLMDHFSPEDQIRVEAFGRGALDLPLSGAGSHSALIRTLSNTDTLLHLLVHGVLDHQFNNGPLLIHDAAALIRYGAVDWERFWSTARRVRVVNACQLGLLVAANWETGLDIDWGEVGAGNVASGLVQAASAMMLVDMRHHRELNWISALARSRGVERRTRMHAMLARQWRQPSAGVETCQMSRGPMCTNTKPGLVMRCVAAVKSIALVIERVGSAAGRRHVRRGLDVAKWLARETSP